MSNDRLLEINVNLKISNVDDYNNSNRYRSSIILKKT